MMTSICTVNTGYPTTAARSSLRSVARTRSLWPQGKKLRIAFMNGNMSQHQTATMAIQGWLYDRQGKPRTNLTYEMVPNTSESDIRFYWSNNRSSWSYIGKDAADYPMNMPTIQLGDDSLQNAYHEFGHALGLLHEHGNPSANIQWNKEVVYQVARQIGWSEEMADSQVMNRYNPRYVTYTEFDQSSVMIYPIDPSWTLNGFSAHRNAQPSETDLAFVASLYPLPEVEVMNSPNTNQTPTINTPIVNPTSTSKSGGIGIAVAALFGIILLT